MKTCVRKLTLVLALIALTTVAWGQAVPVAAPQTQAKLLTPLKVQVVISRYDGDKKVSSIPYMLAVTANEGRPVNLRMGSQLPVPMGNGAINYMNIGTNIDCSATSTDDGRFKVEVRLEDSSIMERRSADPAPTLRTFTASNSLVLRDNQSAQFTAATDKTTGEVVRIDVTLTVEK
jgi:hypothetical protein